MQSSGRALTLALPIADTDETVLSVIEGEVLGTGLINELLRMVDMSAADADAMLQANRERLQAEIRRLADSIAAGVPAATVAPAIKAREAELARIDVRLRTPRPAPPDLERLRAALQQRTEQWKRDLRAEPRVAHLLLKRLVGPLELWDESQRPEFLRWQAETKPASLLDGLVGRTYIVASPTGVGDLWAAPLIETRVKAA